MVERIGDFVSSGAVLYLVLGVLALEALVLVVAHRRGRRTLPLASMLANLAAGACLALALLVVIRGGWWGLVAMLLAGALAAHLIDLLRRLQARR